MRTLDESYALFEKLVDEEKIYMDPRVSFPMLCAWMDAPERELDRRVRSELGLSGSGLLARLREGIPDRLKRKYGITCFF